MIHATGLARIPVVVSKYHTLAPSTFFQTVPLSLVKPTTLKDEPKVSVRVATSTKVQVPAGMVTAEVSMLNAPFSTTSAVPVILLLPESVTLNFVLPALPSVSLPALTIVLPV